MMHRACWRWGRAALAAAIGLAWGADGPPRAAAQQELLYGSWLPAVEGLNSRSLPSVFKQIEEETKGAIKWKLVAGGQIADAKTTFSAVRDGLMQAGLGIPTYGPNLVPSNALLFSTLIPGDDLIAATGAGSEVLLLQCPSCLEEYKRTTNAIPLAGTAVGPSFLLCTKPVRTVEELKGKRVRIMGAGVELIKLAGAVPVGATLTETVGLLQRGGIDCANGALDWLKSFGYGEFTKYVVDYPLGIIGTSHPLMINRDAFHKMTPQQKTVHLRASARLAAVHTIGNFIVKNEESYAYVVEKMGVQKVAVGKDFDELMARYKAIERDRNAKIAKGFGVADPEPILDAYAKAMEKWQRLSKDIGRDTDKLTAALWREVYSKIDPERL
jgi:TRAP-type C4-dicarboxylate transport system substrate-binding protein